MINFSKLTLVPDHQSFGLGLSLFHMIVSVFLDLLKESTEAGFLLLFNSFKSKLYDLLVS